MVEFYATKKMKEFISTEIFKKEIRKSVEILSSKREQSLDELHRLFSNL